MSTTNWGKYPVVSEEVKHFEPSDPLPSSWIARGMGRCYGDSSLGKHMLSVLRLNRFLAFDETRGIVHCEAGVSYKDLLETFVPRGWFPPVTPGTKFVSLGGAIASDVHGKNHHKEGSISRHILDFHLLTGSGELLYCSPQSNRDVYEATFGGMGLTGIILELRIQLKPIGSSQIRLTSYKARNLEEILTLFEVHEDKTYSVAWIDTLARGKKLGRSILLLGEHARREELAPKHQQNPLFVPQKRRVAIPFDFPSFSLNRYSIAAFNFLYYHKHTGKKRTSFADYDSYFYPLDVLHHWNRIYGKRGFTQYQFVIPKEAGKEGLPIILNWLNDHGLASFLSVLKLFGEQEGLMNFPRRGYTLTLDFPITKRLFPLLDQLDEIVLSYGGRVYLTKDVRLSAEAFRKMYPGWKEFEEIRKKIDPEGCVSSLQSQRLGLG